MANLLTSGDIATIFLDRELKVRRFTPAVTKLLSLIETDIGRPDRRHRPQVQGRRAAGRRPAGAGRPDAATAEVQADDGDWYIRRILPYRTKDDRIEGVVITFNDVTELKELADALRMQRGGGPAAEPRSSRRRGPRPKTSGIVLRR